MVALPKQFNTADLPDTSGTSVLIAPGNYKAVVVESELKPTSNGAGQFILLKFIITEGQFQNTELFERLNIINPNDVAVEIAYKTLARISEAVNMTTTPANTEELHNKPLIIEVKTKPAEDWTDKKTGEIKKGKDQSEIKGYKPLPQGSGAGLQVGGAAASAVAAAGFGQPAFIQPNAQSDMVVDPSKTGEQFVQDSPWK